MALSSSSVSFAFGMKLVGKIYLSIVSGITGIMAIVILWRRLDLWIRGSRAAGQFVRWEIQGATRKYYYPVISFELPDGSRYEFVGGAGNGGAPPKVKDVYPVIYPPGQPERAMVLSFLAYWGAIPSFMVLSAAAAVAAIHR
ncbi:MAG: hypothetical protein ACTHLW_03595 [Verrucomicrobiota bacterium]